MLFKRAVGDDRVVLVGCTVHHQCFLEKWFVIELVNWQSLLFFKGRVHVVVCYIVNHGACCCEG